MSILRTVYKYNYFYTKKLYLCPNCRCVKVMSRSDIGHSALKNILIATVAIMVAVGCRGKRNEFSAKITFANLPTQNVDIVYGGENGFQTVQETAMDGAMEIKGTITEPAVVEMFTRDGTLLGRFVAQPGDEIKATYRTPFDFDISGNELSAQLAQFLSSLSGGDSKKLMDEISKYISKNPENPVSGLLLNYYFDAKGYPQEAVLLCRLLMSRGNHAFFTDALTASVSGWNANEPRNWVAIEMLSSRDSMELLDIPEHGNLLIYFAEISRGADTLARQLDIPAHASLTVVHTATDTANWYMYRDKFPRRTRFFWAPAATAAPGLEPYSIPTLPWYIVVDSLRNIIYRGSEPDSALVRLSK